MRCTANTRDPSGQEFRCTRELGHPGLHRYYLGPQEDNVREFPNKNAWFPVYAVEPPLKRRRKEDEPETNQT